MHARRLPGRPGWPVAALLGLLAAAGCRAPSAVPAAPVPKELTKTAHPPYVIEPPDIVQVDLIAAVPKPPYRIRALDVLSLSAPGALPEAPLAGTVTVEPDGTVYLGPPYGAVAVAGLTVDEARRAVEERLLKFVAKPNANVALSQTRGVQQIRGPHLVRADGTIGLGTYGAVSVVGLTLPDARAAIEAHLKKFFLDPEVALDVVGYNSKVYYVVFDGGGVGQQISRLPITGGETVLDAVGQVSGLAAVSDKKRIWISRPGPEGCPPQVLPVDWAGLTERAETATNYQVLPGDRIFVHSYRLAAADIALGRALAPLERMFGIVLLGTGTVRSFQQNGQNGNNGFGNGGFGGF